MNVTVASALIRRALEAGQIDYDTAVRAQAAIRARSYYGNRMTPRDRASIVNVRFGIVDVEAPVAELMARASEAGSAN